ncbi:MAG TPA: GAF domain-containing sensor histidine kinase [Anaerolineales bacterium]|nr:GAF domain-containing sensor histidine kinase [Anaerolineales bacterium]
MVFRPKAAPRSEPAPAPKVAELEARLDHLLSLIQRMAELTATLNYERVLDLSLDAGAAALGAQDGRLISALLLFEANDLTIASSRGLPVVDQRAVFPANEGVLEAALRNGVIQFAQEPARDPELRRLAALHSCQVAACLPLVVGLDAFGVLLFAHPRSDLFSPDRLELLEAVSHQAIGALQNAKLYQNLVQEKERISEVHEEARRKLARDLHDGPTQSISAIAMRVNFARRLIERDVKAAADELFKIEELARRTTKEIRQMLFTLRPLVLESQGLVSAFEQLAAKMKETYSQEVLVEAEPDVAADMELGKQGVVFFIAEEAVNNARKHAKADHIWIRLRREGDLFQMEIEDDGVGFDLGAVESDYEARGSLGMVNLRERTELVSGVIRIHSTPGKGTRITLTVPLTVTAAERLHQNGFVG